MGRIRQLDTATASGIAAGEVVERPSSVVKELVENAIDAGATVISVEIEGGGISLIRVTDDGCGMDKEDAQMAFCVHATSKLTTLADLFNLNTMGFRGEALSSIGAAARVTLRTRQPGDSVGTEVTVENGHVISISSCGCQAGTSVLVRDLFYNLPARYKFLKKDNTEAQYIITLCQRFALIRPDISFRLLHKGKEILHTPGNNDPQSALYGVYGKNIVESCIPVDVTHGDIQIRGFIGKPEIARSNRGEQILFVNERLIRSKTITSAIDEGYKTFLMKGRYAFIILSIYISSSLVDVNAHPQKAEVRFWNDGEIFRAVYQVIQNALLSENHVASFKEISSPENPETNVISEPAISKPAKEYPRQEELKWQLKEPEETFDSLKKKEDAPISAKLDHTASDIISSTSNTAEADNQKDIPAESPEKNPPPGFSFSIFDLLHAHIIGVAFATYILLDWKENIILVDQHAAHEKILFEKLLKKKKEDATFAVPIQSLLSPVLIHLSTASFFFLSQNEEEMKKCGFLFDILEDREIVLRGIPSLSGETDPERNFLSALDILSDELPKTDEQVLLAIATAACKAAVKGNDRLHEKEIQELLRGLSGLSNPYFCPHGRPILICISKKNIEKEFKRIVP